MKHKGKITILFSRERGLTVEVEDALSSETIVRAQLDAEQAISALSRIAYTDCEIKTGELSRVGKVMEVDQFTFPFPFDGFHGRDEKAKEQALELCPEGWKPDLGFNSQGTFPKVDGVQHARTMIRRWVEVEEEEE